MKSKRILALPLGMAIALGQPAICRAADQIYPLNNTSSPVESAIAPQEQGRKGILFKMDCLDATGHETATCWPLVGTPATVLTLTIEGSSTTTLNCMLGSAPNPGQCGFDVAVFPGDQPTDPSDSTKPRYDAYKIFYNGDIPAGANVHVTIANAQGANGTSSNPICPADVGCTLDFSATNSAGQLRPLMSLGLVFDTSGSMSLPAVPTTSTTRIQVLQKASDVMLAQVSGYAMLGDKLGVTFFNTASSPFAQVPANDSGQVAAKADLVNMQSASGSTSIGAGLNSALAGLGDPSYRRYIVLFSDGDQNTAPNVDMDPATCSLPSNTLKVDGNAVSTDIKVCPVTTGVLSACGYRLQQSIGIAACGGQFLHIPDGSTTGNFDGADVSSNANRFFTQLLTDAVIGDKLEIVRDIRGSLSSNTTRTETFDANQGDINVTVTVNWPTLPSRLKSPPAFKLVAPDGTIIDPGATRTLRGTAVTSLHFPYRQLGHPVDPAGTWKIELQGIDNSEQPPLAYQILAVADSPKLATQARAVISDPGTGEDIPLEVKLTDGGAPLAGVDVVAALSGPTQGLGDALSKAATPAVGPPLSGDVAGSPARAKIDSLQSDPAFMALLQGHDLPSVLLTPDSSGVYRGKFSGATKEGNYQFSIVEAGTSSVGKFERTQSLTVFVRPKPDPDRTDLKLLSSTVQPDNSVIVVLSAVARDRFGSLLGPDYGSAFRVSASAGTVETPLTDKLDGSYEIAYRLPPGTTNPSFTVEVMGDTVKTDDLDHIQHGHRHFQWWWLTLLLLLLL